MTSDLTTLRDRLRGADPAAGTAAYSADRQTDVIARVLAHGAPAPGHLGRTRRGSPRRVVTTAVATALAVTSAVVGGAVLQPGSAVAAEMDRLAASAAGPLPSRQYLYTETRTLTVGGTARPGSSDRRWDTETTRAWTGDTCNDRLDTTLAPARFFSAADERAFRAEASEQDLRTALRGWTATVRGEELRALDDVPCTRVGSHERPNPPYAATYPSDPAGFLAKAVRDSGARPDEPFDTPADAVLELLALPYLTGPQRAAALRAFGQAAGDWEVGGHTTVAGVRGLVIRRDLGPVEEERVIAGRAPGLLRSVLRITDADRAAEFDPRYAGLAAGTVVHRQELLTVGVVPDLDSTP